jgi:hypothetical protein
MVIIMNDPNKDAMSVWIGGQATGVGSTSNAFGETTLEFMDFGSASGTVAVGTSVYGAFGTEVAEADTFALVEGADFYWSYTFDVEFGGDGPGPAFDFSATFSIAIDLEDDGSSESAFLKSYLANNLPEGTYTSENQDVTYPSGSTALANGSATIVRDSVPNPDASGGNALTYTTVDPGESSFSYVSLSSDYAELLLTADIAGAHTSSTALGSLVDIENSYSSVFGLVGGIG